MSANLFGEITSLKGVGEKRAKCYDKLGIHTPYDLLCHFPRGYIDFSSPVNIMDTELNSNAVVYCSVVKRMREANIRRGLSIYKAVVTDFRDEFTVVFYNNKYAFDALKEGSKYYLYGKVTGGFTRREMTSPMILPASTEALVQPIYSLTEGLTNAMVQTNIKQALSLVEAELYDIMPKEILQKNSLCVLRYAFENIHFPQNDLAMLEAKKRLVFDELFFLQLGMLMLKGRNRSKSTSVMKPQDISPFCS